MTHHPLKVIATTVALSTFPIHWAHGQSTPSEFADLSLEELFEVSLTPEQKADPSKWQIGYQYKLIEFDGYLDGDSSLSREEVLWSGPPQPRTDKNFPVLPTIIKQRAHLLNIGYQWREKLNVFLSAPYLKQGTDHISIVPGYDEFLIETSGIGDIVVGANYQFIDDEKHNWWFSAGISFPTGSIDEVGDTPRDAGNQPLPYTMQLGSGTFDIPIDMHYQYEGEFDVSMTLSAMLRTGTNDRDYRLGNHYRMTGRYRFLTRAHWSAYLLGEFQYSETIKGRDDDLVVPGAFPYPASITNPALYGGRKFSVRAGLQWRIADDYRLSVEFGKPVYQNLNGPQPKETWRSSIQLSTQL